ncbi:hypothetical protein CLV24_11458 [Pontibacter ummariensis]|uniref:Uncharacterized protein n=1 Tax=Pontibacter ummariensis TaxID=1610492 RepID=A0A239HM47_9BACT|nr:hypothetical protein [Pontibacter ummariensis]PRY10330.1 hypothetical protein CLV24_11458 [Pontibacter ummariensis]SNS82392.1 hypothetical protein SAMN06296052_11458 [Pontibacter ummariensis]
MSDSNRQQLDDRIYVVKAFFHMGVQAVLIICALVAFFIILYHMLVNPDIYAKAVYAAFDYLLGQTLYRVYKYFFILPAEEKTPVRRQQTTA